MLIDNGIAGKIIYQHITFRVHNVYGHENPQHKTPHSSGTVTLPFWTLALIPPRPQYLKLINDPSEPQTRLPIFTHQLARRQLTIRAQKVQRQ